MKNIPLVIGGFTTIDNKDLDRVSTHRWSINKTLGYVINTDRGERFYLHRFIMDNPKGMVVDHINHDKLDNRRSNLRICTIRENVLNAKTSKNSTTGKSGVSYRKDRNKYRAYIGVNRKQISLGNFISVEEANMARKIAEIKYFGEYAP